MDISIVYHRWDVGVIIAHSKKMKEGDVCLDSKCKQFGVAIRDCRSACE